MGNRNSILVLIALIFSMTTVSSAPLNKNQRLAIKKFWTKERLEKAVPRDFVIDGRGLAYVRGKNGQLSPHGHSVAAEKKGLINTKRPGGGSGGDTEPPVISEMNPSSGSTIGASKTFSAKIEDASGIKSVKFDITYPNGLTQSYTPTNTDPENNIWSQDFTGFTDGSWTWEIIAKDNGDRGGNTDIKSISFMVDTNSGGGTGDNDFPVIGDEGWSGGSVQTAAGRLYFTMDGSEWICSGTVVTDEVSGRSTVLTAAHCIYDDVNKAFATYALFIPNHENNPYCNSDPSGCWVMDFGVVDIDWTTSTFPNNIPFDYGFYVVYDENSDRALDNVAGSLPTGFFTPETDNLPASYTHALGYSGDKDPFFRYCAESVTKKTSSTGRGKNRTVFDNWWLSQCGLTPGSSGGPWIQPMELDEYSYQFGSGPIISVNSWKYSDDPLGMAGPRLDNSTAGCIFGKITASGFNPDLNSAQNGHVEAGCQ